MEKTSLCFHTVVIVKFKCKRHGKINHPALDAWKLSLIIRLNSANRPYSVGLINTLKYGPNANLLPYKVW